MWNLVHLEVISIIKKLISKFLLPNIYFIRILHLLLFHFLNLVKYLRKSFNIWHCRGSLTKIFSEVCGWVFIKVRIVHGILVWWRSSKSLRAYFLKFWELSSFISLFCVSYRARVLLLGWFLSNRLIYFLLDNIFNHNLIS